jgi:hypothetical protein
VLFVQKRLQVLVALLLGTSAAGLWLAWPWIVPLVSPVPTSGPGSDLVVVLDGGSVASPQPIALAKRCLSRLAAC